MTPIKIENKNDLIVELVSVSSALHTNEDPKHGDIGGPIKGSKHALEHLDNVLEHMDAGIDGEVERRLKEARIKMEWHYEDRLEEALEANNIIKSMERAVDTTFTNAMNSLKYDFTSRHEIDRFKTDLIKTLARTLCK